MKKQEKSKYSKYLRIEILYGVGIIIITGALYSMVIMLGIGSQEIHKKIMKKFPKIVSFNFFSFFDFFDFFNY